MVEIQIFKFQNFVPFSLILLRYLSMVEYQIFKFQKFKISSFDNGGIFVPIRTILVFGGLDL